MKTMKTIKLIVIALLAVQCSSTVQHTSLPDEFSQWRGPDRDGVYPDENLLEMWPENGPDIIWEFDALGIGYASVAATGNKIFTAGTIDSITHLYAFNHSGELLWKTELGREWTKTFPGIRSTPLIYGDKGYLVNGLGELFCFDTESGAIAWKKHLLEEFHAPNIQHGINENLLIDGEKLFCTPGGPDSNIVALDRNTGDIVWISKGAGEPSAYCSPKLIEVGGQKFIITMTSKSLVSVNADNGEVAWIKPLEGVEYGIHAQTPIYRDGHLFVQDGYEIGCFMLRLNDDGYGYEEVWKNKLLDETNGHAVVLGNRIFGSAETKKQFVCLDWDTGEVLYRTKEISEGTVIAADGMLYCCTYAGELSLVMPGDTAFQIVSQMVLPGDDKEHIAHPVIHDGRLYIRHRGLLRVYDLNREAEV
jgi:outer membrane protein assembly factor BamB